MKGPEPFLKARGIKVRDLVSPRRPAVVDSLLRVFVGHDLFYFADAATRARFVKEPLRYCRRLTDPVTLERAGLVPLPSTRLGALYGLRILTPAEFATACGRAATGSCVEE